MKGDAGTLALSNGMLIQHHGCDEGPITCMSAAFHFFTGSTIVHSKPRTVCIGVMPIAVISVNQCHMKFPDSEP